MNHNFLGAPDREDLRVLDQLRRQLIPMIAVMDKLQVEMQFKMSRGEAVDWPQIHRTTSLVTSYLSSIQTLISGGYKHTTAGKLETKSVPSKALSSSGVNPLMEEKQTPRQTYADIPIDPQAERIRNLHPFPNGAFPMALNGGMAAGMANTLLRKRLEPAEEAWAEERLRKAAEFSHIPPEWDIDLTKKPITTNDDKEPDSQDENDDAASDTGSTESKTIPTTRVKRVLAEDDVLELWRFAHQEAFDKKYLARTYPDEYGGEKGGEDVEGEDEEGDEEDGEEEEDEEEFEDVMDMSGGTEEEKEKGAGVVEKKAEAEVGVGRAARVVKPVVHQPTVGVPVLSLGFVHKFMETGEVVGK